MRWFKKNDIFVIAALLITALLLLFPHGDKDAEFELLADGTVILSGELSPDRVIPLDHYPGVLLEVRGGTVAFISSNCRDQICVQTGFIGSPGRISACLPNGLVLRIYTRNPGEVDAVV